MARNISDLVEVLLGRGKLTKAEATAIAVVCVASAATIFAATFCWRVLADLTTAGAGSDWDQMLQFSWVPYRSVVHFHQVPLWNPWECGGIPMLANPQSRFLTPFFLFHVLFGPVVGLHLEIPLHLAIGWAGMYVLVRWLGGGRMGAVCAASAFCGSSWFYLRAASGHVTFFPLTYLPWILAFAWHGAREKRLQPGIIAAALVAVTIGEGGVHPAFLEMVTLALVMASLVVLDRSPWPIWVVLTVVAFGFGFAAVKLLPTMGFIAQHPRPVEGAYWNTTQQLVTSLLSRDQDLAHGADFAWGFQEYGAYLGVYVIPALIGLTWPRRAMPWALAAIALFVLARGDVSSHAPWAVLHRLPLFHSERLPSRLLIPLVLMIAVLAGLGIDRIQTLGPRAGPAIAAVLIVIGIADSFVVSQPNLRYVLENPMEVFAWHPQFRQYRAQFYAINETQAVFANAGAITCYEYAPFPTNARGYNEEGYRGEQYLLGPGTVTLTRWTPNRLEYSVDAPASSVMVVNQNYDPSWRVASGPGQTFSQDGLLAVRVPAGKSEVDLRYISRAALYGFAITLLTAIAAIVLFRIERRVVAASGNPAE